jgi:hypothetical protein
MSVAAGSLDPHDAEDLAFKESLKSNVKEQTEFLLANVGPRVTAAALGLSDARPLKQWVTGMTGPKTASVAERLRITFRIVYAITGAYSGATAAAFLRSANPQLDDRSPLTLLREQPTEEAERELLATTRAFLEG